MPVEPRDKRSSEFAFRPVGRFLRSNWFAVVLVSALLLVQCFWHSRIQAGDLGSHVYNAWLAQLIEHHQISGLMIARQGSNVLFDLLLLHTANLAGFVAAEKIVVGLAVLVFFWGSFSFLAAASGRPPWLLMPFLFVLSYGYVFHMGFMNYYLSIGLALFALALSWRGEAGNWLAAVALSAVSFLAHPLGFLLAATVSAYIWIWRILPRWWRLAVPALALTGLVALRFFSLLTKHSKPIGAPRDFSSCSAKTSSTFLAVGTKFFPGSPWPGEPSAHWLQSTIGRFVRRCRQPRFGLPWNSILSQWLRHSACRKIFAPISTLAGLVCSFLV